jgi:hypothetical protein
MANSPYALRLSHAAAWGECPAFTRMNSTPQAAIIEANADHTVRNEGTAIHWLAETMIRNPDADVYNDIGMKIAPNGVELTDEMFDAAEFYVGVLDRANSGTPWHIEQTLHASDIHEQCGGTPDAFSFRAASAPEILLYDLKGGYRPVEVFPNPQLTGYLSAILTKYPQFNRPETLVTLAIVQPRAYHSDGPVRVHRTSVQYMVPEILKLRDKAHRAMTENLAVAGPQCDDCAGRASCSVAHAAGMRALEVAGEPDVHDLPVAAIDYELLRIEDAMRMLEARKTGLEAQAQVMIRNGSVFPHFAMRPGSGRLKWHDDAAAIALGDALGKSLRKPPAPITPTQALKFVPKELIDTMASRTPGAVKLTRLSDNDVAKAFANLKKD